MDRLSYKELCDIEKRCNTATPAPWSYDGMHNEIHCHAEGEEYYLITSELREHPNEKLLDSFGHTYNADFDFIASARQDIPKLLSELRYLQKELAQLARESVAREKELAKLEAEVTRWAEAEQDGRLVVLPVAVGDYVYDTTEGVPYKTRVLSYGIEDGRLTVCRTSEGGYPQISEFGDRVFITREDVEAALAQQP